jgi:uroporphyrinogen-III decarboxylase
VAAIADSGALEYTTRAMSRFADRFLLYGSTGAPFWHCYSRLGFVGLMTGLRERPDLVDAWAQADLQRLLAVAAALRHAGVSCMFVEECLSGADLISVPHYRRHALPPTRDLLAGLKGMGFRVVYYYCGSVEGRLEYLAQLPADALAFEESKKGFTIDLGQIRETLGPDRLLFGNTDAVLLRDGSEAQIAADVARQYAAAGPRFVVSQGSPATLDTAPEKLDVLGRVGESAGRESRVSG